MRKLINNLLNPILQYLGISTWVFVQLEKLKFIRINSKIRRKIKVDDQAENAFQGLSLICVLDKPLVYPDFFVKYYKNLGVRNFHFINQSKTDINKPSDTKGISYYSIKNQGYLAKSNIYNYFLKKHLSEKWVCIIEPNQYLVYPKYKTRNIIELTHFLDNLEETSFFTVIVELYRDDSQKTKATKKIKDPFQVYKYIDRFNMTQVDINNQHEIKIQGGPSMRIGQRFYPEESPVINRIPLIKVSEHIRFKEDNISTNTKQMNAPLQRESKVVTGCLLELVTNDSLYTEAINQKNPYKNEYISKTFIDDEQLENEKYMQRGEWF